jgi:hypothetical protein
MSAPKASVAALNSATWRCSTAIKATRASRRKDGRFSGGVMAPTVDLAHTECKPLINYWHDAFAKAIEKSSDIENIIHKQQDTLKNLFPRDFDATNLLQDTLARGLMQSTIAHPVMPAPIPIPLRPSDQYLAREFYKI